MKRIITVVSLLVLIVMAAAGQPKVVAHRGHWMAADGAQNSLASLSKAADINCYGAEFDVHSTVDNVLVVYHDNDIDGVKIQDTTYGNIQYSRLPNGEYLPTLIQYLQDGKKYPNLQLVLEIKPHKNAERDMQVCKAVVDMVDKAGLAPMVEYISFSLDACKELHRLAPDAKVAYLGGNLSPRQAKDAGLTGIDYHYSVFEQNPQWLDEARLLGVEVNVWTVDGDSLLRKFAYMPGIDIITTNQPDVLQKILEK
ncbi:glycerophosphodiester phosphodiesterase family protein [Muribaculum sp.]|jgi:glycerophosphoryl diester phosphodiesterase|uniref:glycerophosphodiester phosphodiesterase n=1 Tax=Muribaculum sp. TaxID=1918611 RepID=UPI00258051E4|nr:glycerophosphodiester phosphodiesterase family protein [Muribaculum sp.]